MHDMVQMTYQQLYGHRWRTFLFHVAYVKGIGYVRDRLVRVSCVTFWSHLAISGYGEWRVFLSSFHS